MRQPRPQKAHAKRIIPTHASVDRANPVSRRSTLFSRRALSSCPVGPVVVGPRRPASPWAQLRAAARDNATTKECAYRERQARTQLHRLCGPTCSSHPVVRPVRPMTRTRACASLLGDHACFLSNPAWIDLACCGSRRALIATSGEFAKARVDARCLPLAIVICAKINSRG
jgi:hypothetical protein